MQLNPSEISELIKQRVESLMPKSKPAMKAPWSHWPTVLYACMAWPT